MSLWYSRVAWPEADVVAEQIPVVPLPVGADAGQEGEDHGGDDPMRTSRAWGRRRPGSARTSSSGRRPGRLLGGDPVGDDQVDEHQDEEDADEDQRQHHLGQQHAPEHRGEADRLEPQVVGPEPGQAPQRGDQQDQRDDADEQCRCRSRREGRGSRRGRSAGVRMRRASLMGASGCGWQGRGKSRALPVTGDRHQQAAAAAVGRRVQLTGRETPRPWAVRRPGRRRRSRGRDRRCPRRPSAAGAVRRRRARCPARTPRPGRRRRCARCAGSSTPGRPSRRALDHRPVLVVARAGPVRRRTLARGGAAGTRRWSSPASRARSSTSGGLRSTPPDRSSVSDREGHAGRRRFVQQGLGGAA